MSGRRFTAAPTENMDFPDDDVFNEMLYLDEEERQLEEKISQMLDWYKKNKIIKTYQLS